MIFDINLVKLIKTIFYIIITIPRDLRGLLTYFKIKKKTKVFDNKQVSVSDVFGYWVFIFFILVYFT
jgi:hypothetical protein